jgi:uncharacterized protein (TIGR03086 family)
MNHSIGVTLKFAGFTAGGTDHPQLPAGDLVGRDHGLALRSAAEQARAAWASADMTRRCRLSFGTFPAGLAAGLNLFDALAHTWDIATATGVTLHCGDDLWTAGLQAARIVIGPSRDARHYAAEIPLGANASPRQHYLAFLGRCESHGPGSTIAPTRQPAADHAHNPAASEQIPSTTAFKGVTPMLTWAQHPRTSLSARGVNACVPASASEGCT